MKKRVPYERDSFELSECKANIQVVGSGKDEYGKYGSAFLNVRLPDGRWVAFKTSDAMKIRLEHEIIVDDQSSEKEKAST